MGRQPFINRGPISLKKVAGGRFLEKSLCVTLLFKNNYINQHKNIKLKL